MLSIKNAMNKGIPGNSWGLSPIRAPTPAIILTSPPPHCLRKNIMLPKIQPAASPKKLAIIYEGLELKIVSIELISTPMIIML